MLKVVLPGSFVLSGGIAKTSRFAINKNRIKIMRNYVTIRCPNCGNHAERYHHHPTQETHTQCSVCDYLMVTCTQTGKVLEAYAPGIAFSR
jgi:predicted RNA-binding Zn-ribbon protein involved in translation (DUF1610 family)